MTDPAYGPHGDLDPRAITLAVVSKHGTAPDNATLARRRLLAVLVATANGSGVSRVTEDAAVALAGLKDNRDFRKTWNDLGTEAHAEGGAVEVTRLQDAPFVMVRDGRVSIHDDLPASPDITSLDNPEQWVEQTLTVLSQEGLPSWQVPAARAALSSSVAAAIQAIDPDRVDEHAARLTQKIADTRDEVSRALRRGGKAHGRLEALRRQEASLQEEIAELQADIDALDATDSKVTEAVRLAREVLRLAGEDQR